MFHGIHLLAEPLIDCLAGLVVDRAALERVRDEQVAAVAQRIQSSVVHPVVIPEVRAISEPDYVSFRVRISMHTCSSASRGSLGRARTKMGSPCWLGTFSEFVYSLYGPLISPPSLFPLLSLHVSRRLGQATRSASSQSSFGWSYRRALATECFPCG